jgi:hypothetical protein
MERYLSSGSVLLELPLCPWPSVGAERRRYGEPHRLGARTGQGRQPRSGRASARALTRGTSSPHATGGYHTDTINPSGSSHATGRGTPAPQPCIRWGREDPRP